MSRRIVVTGLGIITPISCDVEECFQRVVAGESGIHQITLFDISDFQVRIGGDIPDFNASDQIEHRELKRIDRFTQFGIVAANTAIRDSGIELERLDLRRCGVILGSGIGGLITIEEQLARLVLKGPDRVSPLTIPKLMLNAAGRISPSIMVSAGQISQWPRLAQLNQCDGRRTAFDSFGRNGHRRFRWFGSGVDTHGARGIPEHEGFVRPQR